jgi:hypothetical protein
MEFDISVDIAVSYGLDGWGSIPRRGKIFLFSTASRPALGPTQSTIQQVPGVISLAARPSGWEADHLNPVLRSRMMELYLHFPICLHDIVFN